MLRWSPHRRRDLAAVASVSALVFLTSYVNILKAYCEGQAHGLPKDSPVLATYPCNGSGPVRASHIYRFAPRVLYDLASLNRDHWITVSVFSCIGRLLSALLVPDPFYTDVLAPLITYVLRSASVLYHVLLGPGYTPTSTSAFRLFTMHAPIEIFFFFALQPTSQTSGWIELLYGIYNTACGLLLCSWYSGRQQPYLRDLKLGRVLVQRLIVTCANLFLHTTFRRRRYDQPRQQQQRRHHHLHLQHRSPADGVGQCTSIATKASCSSKTQDVPAKVSDEGGSSNSQAHSTPPAGGCSGPAVVAAVDPTQSPPSPMHAAPCGELGRSMGAAAALARGDPPARGAPAVPHRSPAAPPPPPPPPPPPAAATPATSRRVPAAPPAPAPAPTPASSLASLRLQPYTRSTRLTRVYLKIYGAEPH
ncbi:hypothetical protein Agub_g15928, partial [Astrephomene gubernaculifera]